MFMTLMFLLTQLRDHFTGKYNWVSLMGDAMTLMFAKLDLFRAKAVVLFKELQLNAAIFWAKVRGEDVDISTVKTKTMFKNMLGATDKDYELSPISKLVSLFSSDEGIKVRGEITLKDFGGNTINTTSQTLVIGGAGLAGAR
jgi:hypothetical protein